MKISIVIPNYNSGKYLAKSLDSILRQSYPDFEILVVDGGSIDNSLEVLRKYQEICKSLYVISTKTEGAVDHINIGMQIAKGDIVAWLSADDTYEPGCFEAVAKCFFNRPRVQWMYGKVQIIDSGDKEVRGIITKAKEMLQPRYSYPALQCVSFISEPSVFMRTGFYYRIGEYNKDLPLTADYEYWLRAGMLSRPVFVNRYLANWRAHTGSTSVNNYKEQMLQAYQVQKRFSAWWFRPVQWVVRQSTIALYRFI